MHILIIILSQAISCFAQYLVCFPCVWLTGSINVAITLAVIANLTLAFALFRVQSCREQARCITFELSLIVY